VRIQVLRVGFSCKTLKHRTTPKLPFDPLKDNKFLVMPIFVVKNKKIPSHKGVKVTPVSLLI